jgi:hypothetical protein
MAICSICTATAVECQTCSTRFCRTCAYNYADRLGITVEPANYDRSEALVTQEENPIAVIQWYMGNVALREEGDLGRIPDLARPYVQDQMRSIQNDLAWIERTA